MGKAGSDLVSCEGQISDEASSNVELDLDSAEKVAFDSEYIHHRRFDVI